MSEHHHNTSRNIQRCHDRHDFLGRPPCLPPIIKIMTAATNILYTPSGFQIPERHIRYGIGPIRVPLHSGKWGTAAAAPSNGAWSPQYNTWVLRNSFRPHLSGGHQSQYISHTWWPCPKCSCPHPNRAPGPPQSVQWQHQHFRCPQLAIAI